MPWKLNATGIARSEVRLEMKRLADNLKGDKSQEMEEQIATAIDVAETMLARVEGDEVTVYASGNAEPKDIPREHWAYPALVVSVRGDS